MWCFHNPKMFLICVTFKTSLLYQTIQIKNNFRNVYIYDTFFMRMIIARRPLCQQDSRTCERGKWCSPVLHRVLSKRACVPVIFCPRGHYHRCPAALSLFVVFYQGRWSWMGDVWDGLAPSLWQSFIKRDSPSEERMRFERVCKRQQRHLTLMGNKWN